MQPLHTCSQDCETIHREISKKIVSIILNSHQTTQNTASSDPVQENNNKNSWFGLKTEPYHPTNNETDEAIKTILFSKNPQETEKQVQIAIYLLNEGMNVGFEALIRGIKGPLKQSKILLEIWTILYEPKNILLEDLNRIYTQSSYYMRSLYSLLRLLPIQSLLNQKFKLDFEIICDGTSAGVAADNSLKESLLDNLQEVEEISMERVDKVSVGTLQTGHGDLTVSVKFRKLLSFYVIERSQAIKVPKNVLKAKEIQIKSSPSSGDWVDMGKYTLPGMGVVGVVGVVGGVGGMNIGSAPVSTNITGKAVKNTPGRIKVLTTSHKREESHCNGGSKMHLTDFIKTFERPEPLKTDETVNKQPSPLTFKEIVDVLEANRSEKIHFDRWLEEVEISMEMGSAAGGRQTFEDQFSLINLME